MFCLKKHRFFNKNTASQGRKGHRNEILTHRNEIFTHCNTILTYHKTIIIYRKTIFFCCNTSLILRKGF